MKELQIQTSAGFLLAGLVWRPCSGKDWAKNVRSVANERAATSFVHLGKPGQDNSYFALFSEHETPRKNIYSLAVALGKFTGSGPAAVIIQYEEFYAAACVNGRTPILDKVFLNRQDALNEIKEISENLGIKPKVNFEGDHGYEYVNSLEVKLIGPKKGRVPSAKEIPQSNVKMFVYGTIALSLLGWWYDHQKKEEARIEAARIAAEIEADPVPKYMGQLMRDEPFFALTDDTVRKMLADIAVIAQRPKGWIFDEVRCGIENDTKARTCVLKFKRDNGAYSDLQASLAKFRIIYDFPADLNSATAKLDYSTESFLFKDYRKDGPTFIKEDFGDKGQEWLTAGIGVEISQPTLWPQVAGVPQSFMHPAAKMVGEIKVAKLPVFLFSDLLDNKPPNSHVRSFLIKAQDSNKSLDAEVSATLGYHVQQ